MGSHGCCDNTILNHYSVGILFVTDANSVGHQVFDSSTASTVYLLWIVNAYVCTSWEINLSKMSFIHSIPAFPLGRVAEALGGLEIPHGFQQSLIVLLAAHQYGTKQGRRCNHTTWSLVDLWAAFP